MNQRASVQSATPALIKASANSPALFVTGPSAIALRAGTTFAGVAFDADTPVVIDVALEVGGDYGVIVRDGKLGYVRLTSPTIGDDVLGGFHFAPGGSAVGRSGGDDVPAINPSSLWDANFRPACPDPRGMALIEAGHGRFWCDIYLTGTNHLNDGTSRLGATIADGDACPQKADGKRYSCFDYDAASAVMAHHGKALLSVVDFFAAALGVTEKTACDGDPSVTKLDAPRTSRFGIMQATGNMWVWGHDGDPDHPRPSIFGGSWMDDGYAGSRCADVAYYWPVDSYVSLGARGRGDHLQRA